MYDNIFLTLVFNIGFLVLIATFMSRTTLIKGLIYEPQKDLKRQLSLAVFFGLISILSTYTGMGVNGAIVNTRVIGVLSAGLLGGPIAGMGAALIGGFHRWLFDIGGFTAIACAISTLFEGVLGSLFYKRFQSGELRGEKLVLLAAVAEVSQMLIILAVARPFEAALQLVAVIALPMIVLNSCGIVAFIGAFNHIFVEQNHMADSRIRLALKIAEQCLPHLRKGLHSCSHLDTVTTIIRDLSGCSGIILTNEHTVLAHSEDALLTTHFLNVLPQQAFAQMNTLHTHVIELDTTSTTIAHPKLLKRYIFIVAPLSYKGKVIGSLILAEKKNWLTTAAQIGFLDGLAMLFSTQLELSQIDYQKRLLKKAEFQMLQTQVNPHFLFNCLNTISYFCVEKPTRAKELLLILSNYYRYAIRNNDFFVELSDELRHVTTYLELEKARFEEHLTLHLDIDQAPAVGCLVPSLILQPIVENAVQHGRDLQGNRSVSLSVTATACGIDVLIKDGGQGFPTKVLEAFYTGKFPDDAVGLANVHRRLLSIYGDKNGLHVTSTPDGATLQIFFPMISAEEVKELEVISCAS